jgi:DNA-binding transcriptional LysR family regulator
MELRQLRYFVAVADELNFTKAARRLRVAQPALSRQVRQLEDEIGLPLLERSARGASLTAVGEAFLIEARALLAQSEKAIAVARSSGRAQVRSLNVGYAWGLFHSQALNAVARFRRKHRDVAVNLFDMTAPQQSDALNEGRLDAGFIGFAEDAAGAQLSRRKIGACSFLAALPEKHPAAKKKSVDLRALSQDFFCMISTENFPGAAQCAMEACASAGFRPRILETAARGVTMLGLVAANHGIAIVPEPLAALPHPGVQFRPLAKPYQSDLFVVWHAKRKCELRDAFLDSII